MKLAVYTIALNEEQHAQRWAEAWREADGLYVADTGSEDGTVQALRRCGVTVDRIAVRPWRFDMARNAGLSLIPDWPDLCLVADMDEYPQAGWRVALAQQWEEARADGVSLTRIYHPYIWNWNPDGSPGLVYTMERLHSRSGWHWKYPCHEALYPYPPGVAQRTAYCPGFILEHHADVEKERSYYDLCWQGYAENRPYARPAFYWGRELVNHGHYEEAIAVLSEYWSLIGSQSPVGFEGSDVVRMLARCYDGLGRSHPPYLAKLVRAVRAQAGVQEGSYLAPFVESPVLR